MQPFEVGQILKVTKFYSSMTGADPLAKHYPVYAHVDAVRGNLCMVRWLSVDLPRRGIGAYHGPNVAAQVDHMSDSGTEDVYEIIDVDDLPDECCARLAMIKMGIELHD